MVLGGVKGGRGGDVCMYVCVCVLYACLCLCVCVYVCMCDEELSVYILQSTAFHGRVHCSILVVE